MAKNAKRAMDLTSEEREEKVLRKAQLRASNRAGREYLKGGELAASMALTKASMNRTGCKPAHYPNTQEGLDKFIDVTKEYFNFVDELNSRDDIELKLIIDIENWGEYLGLSRSTLFEYSERGGSWSEFIEYVKSIIAGHKKQLAYNFKAPPVFTMFDIANNHGYVNTSEFKISSTTLVVKDNALEREMIGSGLSWNEKTGDFDMIEAKGEFVDADIQPENQSSESYSNPEGRESGDSIIL